jgi:ABC-type multidrug transport system fused ATPase/permease subunit
LTFVVAILTVGTRFTISPAQTGLVLSYILSVQQAYAPFFICSFINSLLTRCSFFSRFGWIVRQGADVENNMNSVERVVFYATGIEQESPHELPDKKPPASWPADGRVELRNVVFKYRPELPLY